MTSPARGAVAWTPGELLQLVRQGSAVSRSSMARLTGLSPSTVATRLESLLAAGYLVEDGEQSERGRKPRELSINARRGVVAAIDIGSRHTRIGLADMAGSVVEAHEHDTARRTDATEFLQWLAGQIRDAVDRSGLPLRGVGLSIAAPVDRETRQLSHPIYLPGWDALDPAETLSRSLKVPAVADNDATLMALAEHRMHYPDVADMLFVKLGSAIGAGVVIGGALHSGGTGGAGEIGHMPTDAGPYTRMCSCGRLNCLEACFGGAAIGEHLARRGLSENPADLAALRSESGTEVADVLRDAGTQIGDAIGVISNLLNPELVVLGGRLSQSDTVTHAIRVALYNRALPLIASGLVVATSRNGRDASILGAAWRVLDVLMSESSVNSELEAGRERGVA